MKSKLFWAMSYKTCYVGFNQWLEKNSPDVVSITSFMEDKNNSYYITVVYK